jgi:O-antigen ligase
MVALVLTFSRGAFVAVAVVGVLYLVSRRSVRTLFFATLAVVAVLALAPDAVYQRAATGHAAGMDAISAGRLNGLWIPLLPDARKHLVFGNGIGSVMWSDAMREGVGHGVLPVTHPHNAYLQAVLDMGVVGLVLLCAYFVHVWSRLRALARDPRVEPVLRGFFQGAAAALVAMLVSDFTDSSLAPRPEQAFLWLAIGMMYGEYARRRAALGERTAQPRAPRQFAAARGPA